LTIFFNDSIQLTNCDEMFCRNDSMKNGRENRNHGNKKGCKEESCKKEEALTLLG
jgi:hypothetical protein